MTEELMILEVVESLKPFIKHTLYALIKASMDTPLSLSEAAQQMGINRATLKKRCQRGQFPSTRINGVYYISKIDINLYIQKHSKDFFEKQDNTQNYEKT